MHTHINFVYGRGSGDHSERVVKENTKRRPLHAHTVENTIGQLVSKTDLECLMLEKCKIGDERVLMLSKTLPQTKITSLGLDYNHISNNSLQALRLADAIKKTPYF